MSPRAIAAAAALVKQFSQYPSSWAMLLAICRYFSIRIDNHPVRHQSFDGMLWYNQNEQQWIVLLNSAGHRYRSHFTVAHEIGHFILHRKLMNAFCCTPESNSPEPLEQEANTFASELLMPLDKLWPYITEYPIPDTLTASRHLGVSQAAINLRIATWRRQQQLPPPPLWRLNPKYQADEFYYPYSKIKRL